MSPETPRPVISIILLGPFSCEADGQTLPWVQIKAILAGEKTQEYNQKKV